MTVLDDIVTNPLYFALLGVAFAICFIALCFELAKPSAERRRIAERRKRAKRSSRIIRESARETRKLERESAAKIRRWKREDAEMAKRLNAIRARANRLI